MMGKGYKQNGTVSNHIHTHTARGLFGKLEWKDY